MSEPTTRAGDKPGELRFAEVETLQDLSTYVARARTLDAEGDIRLQARGTVLAAWVQVLPGQGLLGSGLVLGLRVMQLDGEHDLDVTVPLGAVSDRLARRQSTGDVSAVLSVPPLTVSPAWAAISPPLSGWEPSGGVGDDTLLAAAVEGIEAVAQGTPSGAGAAAVATLRSRVWGRLLPVDPDGAQDAALGIPAGAGLAAYALGFAQPGQTSRVLHRGSWVRVSLRNGEVLAR
ncbi:MAG: hypothetical protein WA966_16680 [Ornithinimicrobium sp.]